MKTAKPNFTTIDEYIATFPDDVQKILQKIRQTIKKAAPKAEETISYQIPTFKLNGSYLIYFAGYKKHVSVYPAPRSEKEFKKELAGYEGGKGTVQFPLDQPIPYELISRLVKFRTKKNLESVKPKSTKTK
jgi:uncharacterized protein YdhG (YjbR/CyaY superfamily)